MGQWRRPIQLGVAAGTLLLVTLVLPVMAAPRGVSPLPGEVVLTEAEQARALRAADVDERDRLRRMFEDPNVLPVSYTQRHVRIEVDARGIERVVEVGRVPADPGARLQLSDLRTADSGGTAKRYDLYISIGVGRLGGSGYRWVLANYFKWNGSNGMDPCNRAEDSIASAWAGDLALYSDASSGKYRLYSGRYDPIDIYRSDVQANKGVGWSFHELKQRNSQVCTSAWWGEGDAYISERTWQNRTDNVTMHYFHTKGTGSYSLGFGFSGITPTVSISPADSNQWSIAAYGRFSH
jgi:hypothetical protein